MHRGVILVTGATGYVGGRLVQELEGLGRRVRCLARQPETLRARVKPSTEVVPGDVRDPIAVRNALQDVDVAYYLVHAMKAGERFVEEDQRAARTFAVALRESGARQLVYLGGLGRGDDLSPHLASRQEVGRILRESGIPTLEFRASIVIGAGSLSFEILRALVERLPVMVTPRWAHVRAQPIWIDDAVRYLVAAAQSDEPFDRVVEIGGRDVLSYCDLMQEYGRQRGLHRLIFPVPVLTPHLSSLWLGLVTPVYTRVGRQLIEGLRNETVVDDRSALQLFAVQPAGVETAIRRTLRQEDEEVAGTRWNEVFGRPEGREDRETKRIGAFIVDSHAVRVSAEPSLAFLPIRRIGGETGWYHADALWRLRGALDRLVGGIGMRSGRPHPDRLEVGSPLDFWRVEAFEPDRLLRLAAEMRMPGRAWLQFEVEGDGDGSTIRQTAIFDPRGLGGLFYWYALYPVHQWIFTGMLREIARQASAARASAA